MFVHVQAAGGAPAGWSTYIIMSSVRRHVYVIGIRYAQHAVYIPRVSRAREAYYTRRGKAWVGAEREGCYRGRMTFKLLHCLCFVLFEGVVLSMPAPTKLVERYVLLESWLWSLTVPYRSSCLSSDPGSNIPEWDYFLFVEQSPGGVCYFEVRSMFTECFESEFHILFVLWSRKGTTVSTPPMSPRGQCMAYGMFTDNCLQHDWYKVWCYMFVLPCSLLEVTNQRQAFIPLIWV